jgi:hypothetical protein
MTDEIFIEMCFILEVTNSWIFSIPKL